MHPLIAYDLAKLKIADLHAEAENERLAASARTARATADRGPLIPVRWTLRRFFSRLHLAGSEA